MSTKKETNQKSTSVFNRQIQRDPASLTAYHALLADFVPQVRADLGDPRESPFFNFGLQTALQGARAVGGRNFQNFLANQRAGGFTGSNQSALTASERARAGRFTSGLQANAFIQNFLAQEARRRQALAFAGAFQPLMTGESGREDSRSQSVEKTSGLGTWLPQAIGMGMAAAMPFLAPIAPAVTMGATQGAGALAGANSIRAGAMAGLSAGFSPTVASSPSSYWGFGRTF